MADEFRMRVNAEGVVALLRANLIDRYKDCFCIIQELLQNADDAEATRVHFGISEGLDVDNPLGRLPALYIVNDGPVSASNMSSIYTVASGDKGNEKGKIGKFGLGMKSVFHVCEGFFMFGRGHVDELPFPFFCTPWTEEYHEDWYEGWSTAKSKMAQAVQDRIKTVVDGWDRWFCVWLPLRAEHLHTGNLTKPIIQMYPTDSDLDEFTGFENSVRAAHMLPLMKHVEHLSFTDRAGESRRFDLEGASRMSGETGRFAGSVKAMGEGVSSFEYSGVERKITDGVFAHLKSLRCWPKNTRFVKGEGLKSFPDKTDSHVAVCFLKEQSQMPSLTIAPCVYLPLSDVRENSSKYTRSQIGGKCNVTIDLHGSLFVDAGRQDFSLDEPLHRDPATETELRSEWNRKIYEEGLLPLVVPELYSEIQKWDDDTANAVMGALRDVPFFSRWIPFVCRDEGIARELTADGFKWSRIGSQDEVFAMESPRSPVVRRVIIAALPKNAHVIDSSAGRLLKPGSVKSEFTPAICELMIRAVADLPSEDSDNEMLRQFAQGCAEKLDFSSLCAELRAARIWKAGDGRYSFDELRDLAERHKLYCHAEGNLRKLFLSAVDSFPVQINEPLAKALGLSVPDFTQEFVLNVLQDAPRLKDVDARCELLKRLLHGPHDPADLKWIKACRYLVHGERRLFDCCDPLFMPVDGDCHDFSEKVVDVLARHKYGTSCRVPKSITDVLNKSDLLALNLPLSTPEGIVCALSEVGDLSGDGFVSDDWRQLVIMVQNPFEQPAVVAALRKIALYPAENGSLVNLEGCSFYEDKYLVAPQLRAFVNILQLDGDERLMGRMKRLAKRWNPNACIQAADRHLTGLCDFVPVVLDALSSTENIDQDVSELLRKKAWVRMSDGRVLAPQTVMNLKCVSGMVPGCDTIAEVADEAAVKILQGHALFLGQQSSVERLFGIMADAPDGRFALGEFKDASGVRKNFDISTALGILPDDIHETMPGIGILRTLRNHHVPFMDHLPRLMTHLGREALVIVLTLLTDRTEEDKGDPDACWGLLLSYLDEAARRTDFASEILPRLRFRNTNGALRKPGELCVGITGAPTKYILNEKYSEARSFMGVVETAVKKHLKDESSRQMSIMEYFSDWLPTLSDFEDRIGGFIICCTDQDNELDEARRRYGFENKSIAETRNSIAADLHAYLGQQHCYVLATPDEKIKVIAIDGTEMDVSLSPLESAKDLFFGQFNQCEIVKNTCLWSMGHPPQPSDRRSLIVMLRKLDRATLSTFSPEKLDALLLNTLTVILHTYGFDGANVEAYWQSLKHVEQLDVRVTKSVILQSLDMYLPQIRCKNERLKAAFKESRRLQYSEEQARLNGNRQQEAAYRGERMELHRQLERSITEDAELQDSILAALRERVRGFSYNIDSILFELFQNADDACEEMCQLCGQIDVRMPNRFDVRYDGHNLIVAHWGRPINQAKVGSESNPKFDEYRVDLQKMILLSQSGKEVEGVPTKGLYGLGFKSVFLVCDTPCILSGKLRFKIVGGLLPEPLDESEDALVREYTAEFEAVSSGVKPTVFILPLRKDVREDVASAVRHFAQEAEVLGIFSRRIRAITIREETGRVTKVDFGKDVESCHEVRVCGTAGEYLRFDTEDATLLTGAEGGMPAPLPADVATYWVTCPTSVRAGLGVAINANLKLDTGRLILDPKSVKNGELLKNTANALYEKLSGWVTGLPSACRYEALAALFNTFTGGPGFRNWDESHADARAMFNVLWGSHGAYRRILESHAALPSGLDGEYRTLCELRGIEWMVDDEVMSSGLVGAVSPTRFRPGNVVARRRFWDVGQIFFPDMIRGIMTYDVVRLLSDLAARDVCLSPEWCAGGNAERLYDLLKPQMERKEVRDVVRCFEFETIRGCGCKPSKLLIREDAEERLRAGFLPDENVLACGYDAASRKLVKLFRCEEYMSAEDLAGFALAAKTDGQREAVLKYLAEGQPSSAFLSALREGAGASWLQRWQEHCGKDALGKKGKTHVMLALSRDDDEFEEQLELHLDVDGPDECPQDASTPCPLPDMPSMIDVRDWWDKNADEWLRKYNEEAYGRSEVDPLEFDIESRDSRSAWMEVLLLGAAHRMGFKLCQHKGFIGFLKRKGWWDEYCEHEVSPQRWLNTLDEYLDEEELAGGEYGHWFNLFVRIYQFSKHLDTYVQLFETWNDADECEKCDLASIKENSKLRGTSIDAPGLQYALGQGTGLAFVYREMVRRHAVSNPILHRFCYVPYPRVSEFGLCIRDSEAIFEKAVRELGREDATFGLAFDIAITSFMKSRR